MIFEQSQINQRKPIGRIRLLQLLIGKCLESFNVPDKVYIICQLPKLNNKDVDRAQLINKKLTTTDAR